MNRYSKLSVILFFSIVLTILCNGCISALIFAISGNDDADYPMYETSEFYLNLPAQQIIAEKIFSQSLTPEEINKFVEKTVSEAIGVPVSVKMPEFRNRDEKNLNSAIRLVVYRFPKARGTNMRSKGEAPMMIVGCTFGVFEVFDPILLPFAIYEHILSYKGEYYVSVFFDEQNQKVLAYGFNVLSGEIARPPAGSVNWLKTYCSWFDYFPVYEIKNEDRPKAKIYHDEKFYTIDGTLVEPESPKDTQ